MALERSNRDKSRARMYRSSWSRSIHIISILIMIGFTLEERVVLLDTTRMDSLDTWMAYSPDHSSGQGRGHPTRWREGSYPSNSGTITRVYTVCNLYSSIAENWLRTPYINVRQSISVTSQTLPSSPVGLYIEVSFTMRQCSKPTNNTRHRDNRRNYCKESIRLLYYEADSDVATDSMPTWDAATYRHIDVLAADQMFVDINDAIVNIETRTIIVSGGGVYLAFYDEGACTTLIAVKVYYFYCPQTIVDFTEFDNTTSGPRLNDIVRVKGRCVKNAVSPDVRAPQYLCKADGEWNFLTAACQCEAGYQPNNSRAVHQPLYNTSCTPCDAGEYKDSIGSERCLACPAHSWSQSLGATSCLCSPGHYRNESESISSPCTRPPSRVRNLTVTLLNETSAHVTWVAPDDFGGRTDLHYSVDCLGCDTDASFYPQKYYLTSNWVIIKGLKSNSRYKVSVDAHNGVSYLVPLSRRSQPRDVILQTLPNAPVRIRSLQLLAGDGDRLRLEWDVDPEMGGADEFEVRVLECETRNYSMSLFVRVRNLTMNHARQLSHCSFVVRGRAGETWGEFSDPVSPIYLSTFAEELRNGSTGAVIGSAIGVALTIILLFVVALFFIRRCNNNKKRNSDVIDEHQRTTTEYFSDSHYIDPHAYEESNPINLINKEVNPALISLDSAIGGGEFSDVFKGRLQRSTSTCSDTSSNYATLTLRSRDSCRDHVTVAVKLLKEEGRAWHWRYLLSEAEIMMRFDHVNILKVVGVVSKSTPLMLITEYMHYGALTQFLRKHDGTLSMVQLTGVLRDIASGMNHISALGYVHRDLIGGNVLINSSFTCKISEFGLTRHISELENYVSGDIYSTQNCGGPRKVPIRWTAPEALSQQKFSSASDIWSYGVVMWEVTSYGETPYWTWKNRDVMDAVGRGFKLPAPMDCPQVLYDVMLDCWQADPQLRPTFATLVKLTQDFLHDPDVLSFLASHRPPQERLHQLSSTDQDLHVHA